MTSSSLGMSVLGETHQLLISKYVHWRAQFCCVDVKLNPLRTKVFGMRDLTHLFFFYKVNSFLPPQNCYCQHKKSVNHSGMFAYYPHGNAFRGETFHTACPPYSQQSFFKTSYSGLWDLLINIHELYWYISRRPVVVSWKQTKVYISVASKRTMSIFEV